MHMMCHLHDMDHYTNSGFSPTKGLMESWDKYLITIEVQMMKRFLNDQSVSATSTPQEFREDFIEFLDNSHEVVGSVVTTFRESFVWPPSLSSDLSLNFTLNMIEHGVVLPKTYVHGVFDSTEVSLLSQLYSLLCSIFRR